MERLSIAISKARNTATQARLEQTRNAMGGASPPAVAAATAIVRTVRKRSPWTLAIPLFLGLAGVTAFWAMRSGPGSEPLSTAMQAEAASAPQAAMAAPPQPTEPAGTEATESAVPASTEEPSAATATATAMGAAESTQPAAPPSEQVETAVEAWRQAWSARNMTAYLDAYSKSFTPPAGMSRKDWIASRYRNVGGRRSIDVQITELQVQILDGDRARANFLQDYTSGSTRETAQPKTLDLVRDADDRWRIVGEWQGDPPPLSGQDAEAGKS